MLSRNSNTTRSNPGWWAVRTTVSTALDPRSGTDTWVVPAPARAVLVVCGAVALGGCVDVAPDDPPGGAVLAFLSDEHAPSRTNAITSVSTRRTTGTVTDRTRGRGPHWVGPLLSHRLHRLRRWCDGLLDSAGSAEPADDPGGGGDQQDAEHRQEGVVGAGAGNLPGRGRGRRGGHAARRCEVRRGAHGRDADGGAAREGVGDAESLTEPGGDERLRPWRRRRAEDAAHRVRSRLARAAARGPLERPADRAQVCRRRHGCA